MNKKYIYLGTVVISVVTTTIGAYLYLTPQNNPTLTPKETSRILKTAGVNSTTDKKHKESHSVKSTNETALNTVTNDQLNEKLTSISDREVNFVIENASQLANILEISSPNKRDYLRDVSLKQATLARNLSKKYSLLRIEASEIVSSKIKTGSLSDEQARRLASVDAELLRSGEVYRKHSIDLEDEARNFLTVEQQERLAVYEKKKIKDFRRESLTTVLNIFLESFENNLTTNQTNSILAIPIDVANQSAIEDYNFGFSLSMWNDSIARIDVGPAGFPATLVDEAYLQLKSVLTPKQITDSKIDERLYARQ